LGIVPGRGQFGFGQAPLVVGHGGARRQRTGDECLGALEIASGNEDQGKSRRRPRGEVGQMSPLRQIERPPQHLFGRGHLTGLRIPSSHGQQTRSRPFRMADSLRDVDSLLGAGDRLGAPTERGERQASLHEAVRLRLLMTQAPGQLERLVDVLQAFLSLQHPTQDGPARPQRPDDADQVTAVLEEASSAAQGLDGLAESPRHGGLHRTDVQDIGDPPRVAAELEQPQRFLQP